VTDGTAEATRALATNRAWWNRVAPSAPARPDFRHVRVSGEHPAYGCVEWDGQQYVASSPYSAEGPRELASWKGVPIVTHRRTRGTFVSEIVRAGLQIETLVEGEFNPNAANDTHADPVRWYAVARARLIPTTFVIKARKPRARSPSSSGNADPFPW
jgi:hypothetical protein